MTARPRGHYCWFSAATALARERTAEKRPDLRGKVEPWGVWRDGLGRYVPVTHHGAGFYLPQLRGDRALDAVFLGICVPICPADTGPGPLLPAVREAASRMAGLAARGLEAKEEMGRLVLTVREHSAVYNGLVKRNRVVKVAAAARRAAADRYGARP